MVANKHFDGGGWLAQAACRLCVLSMFPGYVPRLCALHFELVQRSHFCRLAFVFAHCLCASPSTITPIASSIPASALTATSTQTFVNQRPRSTSTSASTTTLLHPVILHNHVPHTGVLPLPVAAPRQYASPLQIGSALRLCALDSTLWRIRWLIDQSLRWRLTIEEDSFNNAITKRFGRLQCININLDLVNFRGIRLELGVQPARVGGFSDASLVYYRKDYRERVDAITGATYDCY